MNYFEHNLRTLRERDVELARRLEKLEKEKGILLPVADENGHANIQLTKADGSWRWLYENPARSIAQMEAELPHVQNTQTVILLGLGLGYHLEVIARNSPKTMRFIVVVEPSLDLFCAFLATGDRRSLLTNDRILWIIDSSEAEIDMRLSCMDNRPEFVACSVNDLKVGWEYQSPHFETFKTKWRAYQEHVAMFVGVNVIDAYYGFMNFSDNWKHVGRAPLLPDLKGIFSGKPGVLVGSGPSLTLSLDWLRQVQDKVVIFATASSLLILLKSGIRAYLTSCLERNPDMSETFKDIDTKDVTMITTPIVHREVFDIYEGPLVFLGRYHHFLPAVFPDGVYDNNSVTSVSHVGLQALAIMGCQPIYLVGQDLALDPVSREAHAEGYLNPHSYDEMLEFAGQTRRVRSNKGPDDFVETWYAWYEYGIFITAMIRNLMIECFNVIPSNYGIFIEGTKRLDLDEAAARLSGGSLLSVKDDLDKAYKRVLESKGHVTRKDAEAFPARAIKSLENIIGESTKISGRIYDYLASYPNPPREPSQVAGFKQFMKEIEEASEKVTAEPLFQKLVFPLVIGHFYSSMMHSYALLDQDESDPEVYAQKLALSLGWYSEMIVRCRLALRRIRKLALHS